MKFDLLAEIKDLERPLICFERDDLLGPVHEGTVCLDWSPDDFIVVLKVDDDNFGGGIFAEFLANADIIIGFKSLVTNEHAPLMLGKTE